MESLKGFAPTLARAFWSGKGTLQAGMMQATVFAEGPISSKSDSRRTKARDLSQVQTLVIRDFIKRASVKCDQHLAEQGSIL